jgi:hypothetical protein
MIWEAVFMLVLLKIPVVYLALVVWWAIRATPADDQLVVATVSDTPPSGPAWGVGDRSRPAGRRPRRPVRPVPGRPRSGATRAEVRR